MEILPLKMVIEVYIINIYTASHILNIDQKVWEHWEHLNFALI